jgi:hypothetical protein
MVQKYLKVSDFIEHILDNQEIFLGEDLEGIQNRNDQRKIQMRYIKDFLLQVQDVINFDKTVGMMIRNKVHDLIIDELFE